MTISLIETVFALGIEVSPQRVQAIARRESEDLQRKARAAGNAHISEPELNGLEDYRDVSELEQKNFLNFSFHSANSLIQKNQVQKY